MHPTRYARGAVVRCNTRTWIVWTYSRGQGICDPIALPVMPQTGPRHRSQERLDFGGRSVLVRLLEPTPLARQDCELIGQCTPEIVARLAISMQRAIDAIETERPRMRA